MTSSNDDRMTIRHQWVRAFAATMIGVATFAGMLSAQAEKRSVADGVYTADQARRGRDQYRKRCVLCHQANGQGRRAAPQIPGESLEREGDKEAPPVAGAAFLAKWNGQTAKDLFEVLVGTMPVGGVGSLSPQEYTDVVAYLLEMNKFPAGSQELPAGRDALALIAIK
jgi:cytochrome c